MSRKNEDSIEKFFRKGVRQSDTTFRESDWLALEKRLEEHAQVRAATRAKLLRQMAIGAAGILLISMSVIFFLPTRESRQREVASADRRGQSTAERQSTVHGPQSTVEKQSTVHGPQSTVNAENRSGAMEQAEPRSTADNTLEEPGTTAQPINDTEKTNSNSSTQYPSASLSSRAGANKGSGVQGRKSIATAIPQPNAKAQPLSSRAKQSASSPSTGNTSVPQDVQTAGVQQTAARDQNTQATRKPRLLKRSEATAVTKPVSRQPTVANASERPGRASQPKAEESATAAHPSAVDAVTPSAQQASADARKDRSATPIAATALPAMANREAGRLTIDPADPGVAHPTDEHFPTTSQPVAKDQSDAGASSTVDRELSNSESPSNREPSTVDRGLRPPEGSGQTVDSSTTPAADTTQTDTTSLNEPLARKQAAPEEKKDDKPRLASRWNAALVIAPDFSSTGFGAEMSAPGQAFGAQIGYRLSKRFTVVSGVIRSSKKYVGYGKDYTPPEGYWDRRTNGVVPDEIRGSCTIVEVPIAVQFDVWQSKRARLYIAGGVVSYYMRHEKYDYIFDEPNAGADGSWSTDISSSYAFKVGHLSAAYEIMLTKSLGVSVEPYIKIPFQGIGWANISLYTTGAYINARYFFSRKNLE